MEKPVLITIVGTQRFAGDEPDTIELVTHGTYRYEPGCITLSYVETEMTGLEGHDLHHRGRRQGDAPPHGQDRLHHGLRARQTRRLAL